MKAKQVIYVTRHRIEPHPFWHVVCPLKRVQPGEGLMSEATSGTVTKRRTATPNARGAQSKSDQEPLSVVPTSIQRVEADGVRVFYRSAGDPNAPVVLLLHGFPASSFMFRELIPRLASQHRVIAPDLPGFGFTEVAPE